MQPWKGHTIDDCMQNLGRGWSDVRGVQMTLGRRHSRGSSMTPGDWPSLKQPSVVEMASIWGCPRMPLRSSWRACPRKWQVRGDGD